MKVLHLHQQLKTMLTDGSLLAADALSLVVFQISPYITIAAEDICEAIDHQMSAVYILTARTKRPIYPKQADIYPVHLTAEQLLHQLEQTNPNLKVNFQILPATFTVSADEICAAKDDVEGVVYVFTTSAHYIQAERIVRRVVVA